MPDPDVTPSELVRANRFAGALSPRVVGRAEAIPGPSWAAVLVEEGAVAFGPEDTVAGPAFAWRPWMPETRMRIAPGTMGAYVLVGSTPLRGAIGTRAETTDLHHMADRRLTIPLAGRPDLAVALAAQMAAIHAERAADAPAARTVVEAHLRILLVHLWRAWDVSGQGMGPRSPAQQIFNRFHDLVERHFRDRWTVARYAAALGVSRDRLGDICRRIRGRSPSDLIAARVAGEARLLLANSTNSVEQIAALLGFHGAANFNRFFRRATGEPPGRYRARQARGAPDGPAPRRPYEWP